MSEPERYWNDSQRRAVTDAKSSTPRGSAPDSSTAGSSRRWRPRSSEGHQYPTRTLAMKRGGLDRVCRAGSTEIGSVSSPM